MNILGETQAAPGYGCLRSPVVIIGQSLCRRCHRELDIVRPKLVIGLGQDAIAALQSAHP